MNENCTYACMDLSIQETLDQIRKLAIPVVRSCHVGNNTSNVWGWLALAQNSKIVQFDHSLYGVDENCMPWMVLGDRGRVEAFFNHRGELIQDAQGQHVMTLLNWAEPKYFSCLNYGIFANHLGGDLILHHIAVCRTLCQQMNRSPLSFNSTSFLNETALLSRLVHRFMETKNLHLIFDRWVSSGKKGMITTTKILRIEYVGPLIRVKVVNDKLVFEGDAAALMECFLAGMQAVTDRLHQGKHPGQVNYPWMRLYFFSYLWWALIEADKDPSQTVFWHAGGSSSQYYVNDPETRESFNQLRDLLVAWQFLPPRAQLRMIPTYCCQLFATTYAGQELLAEMIDVWRRYLDQEPEAGPKVVKQLANVQDPFPVLEGFMEILSTQVAEGLVQLLTQFNLVDANALPIAHVARRKHPSYNKFGIGQHQLIDKPIHFPENFTQLTWGEAELLVKTLAHLTIGETR